jgi:outer membrane receptor protein involved in Fe transport
MRGVASGGDGNHSGPLPSVGVYLDEQPITTTTGALDLHLYDVARVESLAGPQGTLYGASSQAGTIRIITNKPDPSAFSASYGLELNSVGEGGEGYLAEAHVNIPVGDRAAIRLVGWGRKDAGYIDNVPFQRTWPACATVLPAEDCTTDSAPLAEDDFNDVETYGARAALRIDLNDNWTVTPTVMGQKMYADGVFGYDVTQGELEVAHVYPDWSEDKWWQAALTVEGRIANFDVTYAGAYLDRQVDSRLDYSDYSYFYDSLYSYSLYITDDVGNPTIGQYIWGKDGYEKISHELRFSTPADLRVRFVGGLFYQQQTHDITQRYWVDNLAQRAWVPGWEDTIWLTQQQRVDEDQAIFGELSFDITDKLTATGGLRYYKFDNTLEGFFGYGAWERDPVNQPGELFSSNGVADCQAQGLTEPYRGAPCKRIDKGTKDEDYLGKVNLTYKFTDDLMVYATWSEGYRPGGINRRGTLPPYAADFLTNYEFGWKTTFADGRVRLNGAVFYQEWDDFQFSLLGANGLTEIKNAAGAEIKGVEMDLTWALSDTFQVSGGVAYIDSELTAPYCGFVDPATQVPVAVDPCPDLQDSNGDGDTTDFVAPEAREGTPLPVTPEWKGNLTLRQDFTLGEFESYWRASYIYKGSSRADLRDAANEILGEQPSYDIIDFSLGADRGSWGLELFVNNVTDERTVLYRTVQCAESICGAEPYIYTTPPRTIGLKFTQNFGK